MTTDMNPDTRSPASAAEDRQGLSTSAIVRTQRALQILRILQAGQVWSATELAAQFDCSTRTIFRDLQLLRDCGIPIDSPRGERGFKLAHDFFWHPERPTLEELTALVVGARIVKEAMPRDMARHLGTAVAKLVGSEKPAVRQRLTELHMRIDAPHLSSQGALPDVEFLPALIDHIVAQTHLRLVLTDEASGGTGEVLEVIPVRLQFTGEWMLVTTAWEGGSERALPLSHIARVEEPPGLPSARILPQPAIAEPSAEHPSGDPQSGNPPLAAAPVTPAAASEDQPTSAQHQENQTMITADSE